MTRAKIVLPFRTMASQSNAVKDKLIDDEEVLQAVILADSFNKRFKPLTARKPRVRMQVYFSESHADELQDSACYPSVMLLSWTGLLNPFHWQACRRFS